MATVFKRVKDTQNALEDWMNQQPQSNSSTYESALNEALDVAQRVFQRLDVAV